MPGSKHTKYHMAAERRVRSRGTERLAGRLARLTPEHALRLEPWLEPSLGPWLGPGGKGRGK